MAETTQKICSIIASREIAWCARFGARATEAEAGIPACHIHASSRGRWLVQGSTRAGCPRLAVYHLGEVVELANDIMLVDIDMMDESDTFSRW